MRRSLSTHRRLAVLSGAASAILCLCLTFALRAAPEEGGAPVVHAAPAPLPASFKPHDWPRFLGETDNAVCAETGLLKQWPAAGPRLIWEYPKGEGWSCPAVVGDRVILFHRLDNKERVDCLSLETAKLLWTFQYDAPYRDRYGASEGPRTSPVVADGRVFVYGVSGQLNALNLADGKLLWNRDIDHEFRLVPNFFGRGSTPLVVGNKLIMSIGGKDDVAVAALDVATGKTLWTAKSPWGASYASPIPATIQNRSCVLVFAGGESRPPTGGLLCIDSETGAVLSAVPHRAPVVESVSASSPAVLGDSAFITESYGSGGEMIAFDPSLAARSLWKSLSFGVYFMTPVIKDGCLFGFDGQQPRLAELVCFDAKSGKELWRNDLGGEFGRGSILLVDGEAICLGEFGDLARLELSPKGVRVLQRVKLFNAPETWTLPALSHGLLFVCQNERSSDGHGPRLLCYDLRPE